VPAPAPAFPHDPPAAPRAGEAGHHALVDQLSAIIYTAALAPGYPTLSVSPQVERLLGFAADEWLANPRLWLERVHADDRDRVARDWDRAHAAGRPFSAEYRMVARDGRVRWFRDEAVLLRDARGRPAHIQGVMLDVSDRKAAEAALRAREQLFRALVERGNDLVMISGPPPGLVPTYVSPSVVHLLGYTPEEFCGCTPDDVLHPDDLPGVHAGMREIFAVPGTVRRIAWRIRHKDGSWRHYDAIGRTLDPHSAARGAVCNCRDVTEQREAEEALRRSEGHFRSVTENASDLVLISRTDGVLTYVSPSARRVLGRAPEELVGRDPAALAHPDDLPGIAAAMAAMVGAPGTEAAATFRLRHADGGWRTIEAVGRTLAPDTAADGIVAHGRDATERRAAEAALQRSEEHFRRLIENASDLVMVSRPDGPLTYASPSVERLLGYTPDEMLGRAPDALVHPDDVGAVWAALRRIAAEPGTVHAFGARLRHKDGGWRTVEALGRTVAPDTAAEGIVANSRDVTARLEAEAALRQAKADAEQARAEAERANRAKSEFLSRTSHELRTPMNSILGFAQVLEDVELPPEYRAGVRHILGAGRHLLGLINDVLDIARIEAGEQALSLEAVAVRAAAGEAADMVRPLAAARGVRVVDATRAAPHDASGAGGGHVLADRQRLVQVLLNLLSNAVKYNRAGGTVRVDAAAAGPGRVRIRVRDEGAGLTPEQQAQLFVPFARLGAERTGVEGTGLGLALSHRLAHAMGGALALEHSGPDGSVFCVELAAAPDPCAAGAGAAAAAGAPPRGAPAAPATLLHVEDNPANLALVETVLLSRPEWRVIPAMQGRLGLALAAEHRPDLVLLDLHLPDLHGAEVLRRLRADPETAATPVVVVSADATPRTAEALAAAGADAFLAKPLDVRLFVDTVGRLLAARAGRPG
jgi:PAS domain S-box-containing protein